MYETEDHQKISSAGRNTLSWSSAWENTTLAISIWEMSPNAAAWLIDQHDRRIFHFTVDEYDDLLLRACGYDFSSATRGEKHAVCAVCSKTFQVLRVSAMYCSPKCRVKAARRRYT